MRNHLMFSKLLALFVAAALPIGPALAASGRISVRSDHVRRTALVVEFQRLKKMRRPTILVLHAGGGDSAHVRRVLGLDEVARTAGMAIVYPDSIGRFWRGPRTRANRIDDVVFIKQLIAKLVSDGIADRRRVYLSGVGTGGVLAMRLACNDANLVAGVAAIGSRLPPKIAATCRPSRPVPLLLIDDAQRRRASVRASKASPLENTRASYLAQSSLAPFAKADRCDASAPTRTFLPTRKVADRSRVVLEKLNGCKALVEFIHPENVKAAGLRKITRRARAHPVWSRDIDLKGEVARFFERLAR